MNQEPIKWRKHLVLPTFGLRAIEDLQSEIHRYRFQDIEKVIENLKDDMQIAENQSNLYTISLVKRNQLHKLPNVNISNREELEEFYHKYSQATQFSEIWVCRKKQNKKQDFLVGRISFDTREQRNSIDCQTIEQVWNVSHRDIEGYTNRYDKAYIRASRIAWGMRYKIEELNVPKVQHLNQKQMTCQFAEVVKEIERRREKIENFEEYLSQLGINQFSLEYLLQEGKFLFIDWDSQNDLKVINGINRKEEER